MLDDRSGRRVRVLKKVRNFDDDADQRDQRGGPDAATRAELFRRAIVGGGALVGGLAAWGVPELTVAASKEQDARVLNLVLALEYTEAAFCALGAYQTVRTRLMGVGTPVEIR